MKNYILIGLIVSMILLGGCKIKSLSGQEGPYKYRELAGDIWDTTCGGKFNPLSDGVTNKEGKYILEKEDGIILIKDSVTDKPIEDVKIKFMVSCSSQESTGELEHKTRTLQQISFQLVKKEGYNIDVGTVSFFLDTGFVTKRIVYIIPETAYISDGESAIKVAESNKKINEWISKFDKVYSQADAREGNWRVNFQAVKDNIGSYYLTVYINPRNGEVVYTESDPWSESESVGCYEGLTRTNYYQYKSRGELLCKQILEGQGHPIRCITINDGICGPGENKCNSPEDCS